MSIEVKAGGDRVVINGGYGNSLNSTKAITLSYDIGSGTVIYTSTVSASLIDRIFSIVTDSFGNIYSCGSIFNGISFDAFVQKRDTSLAPIWTNTFSFGSFDDHAFGIDLDDSLNVYVCGSAGISANQKSLYILKYNNSGNLKWRGNFKSESVWSSEGFKIHVKNYNEIFVAGHITKSNNQNILVTRFNNKGDVTLESQYDNGLGSDDTFMDFAIDSTKIYITARSFNGTNDDNVYIRMSYQDFERSTALNSITGVEFSRNQIIIGFNKSVLKMNSIDNKNIVWGKLNDFVQDSTCDKLSNYLFWSCGVDVNARNFKTRKILPWLTSKDTISNSRMGDNVKIPPLYGNLLVSVPNWSNFEKAADTIAFMKPDIDASQKNYAYEVFSAPNDPLFSQQANLAPTVSYPNCNIDVITAWNFTKGNSFINVGIYDTGIDVAHPDFGGAVITGSTAIPLSTGGMNDVIHHGTQVAGIIGARSNNGIGTAGIAGGDAIGGSFQNNDGVKLFNMKVMEFGSSVPISTSDAMGMIVIGATSQNNGGFGLHIMNHSYGRVNIVSDPLYVKGLDFANKNGVAFVASRGQYQSPTFYPLNTLSIPATLKSYKVMNVGAIGTNGNRAIYGTNGETFTTFTTGCIDFVGPGGHAAITAPASSYDVLQSAAPVNYSFTSYGGTSSAAPHVSGIAALMMSYRNSASANWNNLVHEDIEHLLKRTAKDLTVSAVYNEAIGVDSVTGYGLVQAGAAIAAIGPNYFIRHIDKTHFLSSVSTSTSNLQNVGMYFYGNNPYSFPAGSYTGNVVEVQTTYNYNFPNETFLDSWPLYKISDGLVSAQSGLSPNTDEESWVEVISSNISSTTLKTYALHFTQAIFGGTVDLWIPSPPATLKQGFTLYSVKNSTTSIKENEKNSEIFQVFPNPTKDKVILSFVSTQNLSGTISVCNLLGVELITDQFNWQSGINSKVISISELPNGIYFVTLEGNEGVRSTKKIIKE